MSDLKLLISFKSDLNNYSIEQLRYISEEGVWSIGQMYDHLIVVAHEYLDSMEECAALNENNPLGKQNLVSNYLITEGFHLLK
ncbi:DinB family protein [Rossellomorea sp. NPDC071047]|uniref:DinB family protein n=1 Tax=Rossellomorea sp. NPDC071047 TaxID=3390675 RepID=UPI003CFE0E00